MLIYDTCVKVQGLRLYAYHGVLPMERKIGNLFEVSVTLYYDAKPAMTSDNINDALNYANVVTEIKRTMLKPQHLLEHVAYNIVAQLNAQFSEITRGSITIKKIKPPISEDMDSVSFSFNWQ